MARRRGCPGSGAPLFCLVCLLHFLRCISLFKKKRDELGSRKKEAEAVCSASVGNGLSGCLNTGARRDEIFRLQWKDVDFSARKIRLHTKKTELGEWKYAWIPLTHDLEKMLREHQKTTGLLRFVFLNQCDEDPQKWVPYQFRQHWLKKLCVKAGVKQFGFHGIRHLFASILASKNIPLVEIQKVLRHGSITTTARYIHSLDAGNREAVEVLPGLNDQKQQKQNAVLMGK